MSHNGPTKEEIEEAEAEGNYCLQNGQIGSLDLGPCPICYGDGFYYDEYNHKTERCPNSVRKEQERKDSKA